MARMALGILSYQILLRRAVQAFFTVAVSQHLPIRAVEDLPSLTAAKEKMETHAVSIELSLARSGAIAV
jgi:hypothetical protein